MRLGTVDRPLSEAVWNSVVILRELQAEGYRSGETIQRQYIAPKRTLRLGDAAGYQSGLWQDALAVARRPL